jgi:hypothetical protein
LTARRIDWIDGQQNNGKTEEIPALDESTFRNYVKQDLAPFLEGTVSDETFTSTSRDGLASYENFCRLFVKPTRESKFRVAIDRSQRFERHEELLAKQFIDELAAVIALDAGDFQLDLRHRTKTGRSKPTLMSGGESRSSIHRETCFGEC